MRVGGQGVLGSCLGLLHKIRVAKHGVGAL